MGFCGSKPIFGVNMAFVVVSFIKMGAVCPSNSMVARVGKEIAQPGWEAVEGMGNIYGRAGGLVHSPRL
jgi:hypothetical protein